MSTHSTPRDPINSSKDRGIDDWEFEDPSFTAASVIRATLFSSWVNLLLICVPAGFAVNYTRGKSTETFIINFFAIIPLSKMSEFTLHEIEIRNESLASFLYVTLW